MCLFCQLHALHEHKIYSYHTLIVRPVQIIAYRGLSEYDDMISGVQPKGPTGIKGNRDTHTNNFFSFTPPDVRNRERDDHVRMHSFLPATQLQHLLHILGIGT